MVWSVDVCRNESTTLCCCSEDPTELDSVKKALTTTLKKNTKGADTGLLLTGCLPLLCSTHTHLTHTHLTHVHTCTSPVCVPSTDTLLGIFEHIDGEDEVLRERAVQFVQESMQSLRGEVFGPGRVDNEKELMENIKKVRGGVLEAGGRCSGGSGCRQRW